MKRKRTRNKIMGLVGTGLLVGAGSYVGSKMPGTSGAPLTSSMGAMANFMPVIATATGAGMAMDAVRKLPRPRLKRNKKRRK